MTRRCCARRMWRRLVLKLRFSYGFRGLFGSCPVLSCPQDRSTLYYLVYSDNFHQQDSTGRLFQRALYVLIAMQIVFF